MDASRPPLAGRYRYIRTLRTAPGTATWLATDETTGRQVVAWAQPSVRFAIHARSLGVTHPNLAPLVDWIDNPLREAVPVEDAAGALTVVLAVHVPGETLAERLVASGPLDPVSAVVCCGCIASALQAIHGAGSVHGAVSPSTIVVAPSGTQTPVLTQLAEPASPAHTSPERLDSGRLTAADDVWALHATLFHALTGVPPYPGESDAEIKENILREKIGNLEDLGVTDVLLQGLVERGLLFDLEVRRTGARATTLALTGWLQQRAPDRATFGATPGDTAHAGTSEIVTRKPPRSVVPPLPPLPRPTPPPPPVPEKVASEQQPAEPGGADDEWQEVETRVMGQEELDRQLENARQADDDSGSNQPQPPKSPGPLPSFRIEEAAPPLPRPEPPPAAVPAESSVARKAGETPASADVRAVRGDGSPMPPVASPKAPRAIASVEPRPEGALLRSDVAARATEQAVRSMARVAASAGPPSRDKEASRPLARTQAPRRRRWPLLLAGAVVAVGACLAGAVLFPGSLPPKLRGAAEGLRQRVLPAPPRTVAQPPRTAAVPVAPPVPWASVPPGDLDGATDSDAIHSAHADTAVEGGAPAAVAAPGPPKKMPECVQAFFDPDAFAAMPAPALEFSFICAQSDPRMLRHEVERKVVAGAAAAHRPQTAGQLEWAQLGPYQLALVSVIRGACCDADAAPLALATPSQSCPPLSVALQDLAKNGLHPVVGPQLVTAFEQSYGCHFAQGLLRMFTHRQKPTSAEREALERMLRRAGAGGASAP